MKRLVGLSLVIGALIVMGLPGVQAETRTSATVRSNSQFNTSVLKMNSQTSVAANAEVATQALAAKYAVNASVINDLRRKGRTFGEINVMLALASNLQGGATASNLARVEGLRYGSTVKGWGQVAQELNLNVGNAVSRVENNRSAIVRTIRTTVSNVNLSNAQLNASVLKINSQTSVAANAEVATRALAAKYGVNASVINDLRSKGRTFGEINIILALASDLQGGATTANIAHVESLRYGTTVKGWGQVAHELNLNLGNTIGRAEKSRLMIHQRIQLGH